MNRPEPVLAPWLPHGIDWSRWTVVLLKPDAVRRGLVEEILDWIAREVVVLERRTVRPTEAQIFAHYDDMLPLSQKIGRDVPAELRRIFVGQDVVIALARGVNAAPRVRSLLGGTDPARAPGTSIRGRFADDSLAAAQAEGRLVDNLVHSSDDVPAAARDFGIWFTADDLPLLAAYESAITTPTDAKEHS